MRIGAAKFPFLLGLGALLAVLSQGASASPPPSPHSSSLLPDSFGSDRWQVELQTPDLPTLGEQTEYLPEELAVVHLVLKLGQRRVYVHRGEEILASYPVAIGTANTPTPTGEFEVFQMIENPVWQNPWTGEVRSPGANSALGLRWIAFNEMPHGIIGFHGTPTISSIGRAASNGCVRMHNADVVALFEQVEIGTTVIVEP
ncbi:L,D-transpeptidase [Leptolyngbya sp. FACHB-671]|uniref:L,D-transpeptidase n=1 Tax=Leptolyngbya sp. FACHB-671 TaxID=2692812 RepID=UPI0016840A1F|nr:L,D-transpeptidase [Leptolyngbya sp. FACHB-671]MBD2072171.1 L,D-transpeptidase [Leptolyngbya sp. FACHB-671]